MVEASTQPEPAAEPTPSTARRLLPWLPLVLGAVLGLAYLEYARRNVLILLDHAAFGRDTAVYSDANDRAQCSSAMDSADCVAAWERAGKKPVILWFGNSQLQGINRAQPGDINAPGLLRAMVEPRGYRLVTYAQPNANLSEQTISFDALAPVYNPKVLLLPVCYDDIRELQVRDEIAAFRPGGAKPAAAAEAEKPSEPGKVATHETVQAKVEGAVTSELSEAWGLWRDRSRLRGTMGFAIHALRNQALGIHSNSKRKVDPGLYRERMKLLDSIVAKARAQGIEVLLYAPPYRQDIDGPYIMPDYTAFKADLKALAERHGARFADLDPIVPGPEWATVTDDLFGFQEPDFMHFTGVGHKRLSAALDQQLRAMGY